MGKKEPANQTMLIKIAFTVAVIIGVIIFFRHKQGRAPAVHDGAVEEGYSVSPRVVAYGLLGVLCVVSVVLFALNWHSENRVVDIRVISDGAITHYQARYKSVTGRNFVTLDGTRITPGISDRIEMLEP